MKTDIITLEFDALLPGVGKMQYLLNGRTGELVLNINGVEVSVYNGLQAIAVFNGAKTIGESPEDQMLRKIQFVFQASMSDICESTRKREVVERRQIAMHMVRTETGWSYKKVGQLFNDFDHATVLHSCKTVVNLANTNKEFRIKYNYYHNRINLFENDTTTTRTEA